jgi:hypothetical protein
VNKQAPELSAEARRIINEARGVDDPTAEDQARVKARWLASVAAVAGVSSLTEAARAAGGIGWGVKAAGVALVAAAAAIGLFVVTSPDTAGVPSQAGAQRPAWTGTTHARFEKTPSGQHAAPPAEVAAEHDVAAVQGPAPVAATPVMPPAALPTVQAVPVASDSDLGAPPPISQAMNHAGSEGAAKEREIPAAENDPAIVEARVAREEVARTAPHAQVSPRATRPRTTAAPVAPLPSPAQPSAASGQLGDELALLSEVRGSVQEGAPTHALELLTRYRARFGKPILGMEADALRVDALCKSGQLEAARASVRAFQNDWPGSPLQRRVSSACP